jgi:hypothetical protein
MRIFDSLEIPADNEAGSPGHVTGNLEQDSHWDAQRFCCAQELLPGDKSLNNLERFGRSGPSR